MGIFTTSALLLGIFDDKTIKSKSGERRCRLTRSEFIDHVRQWDDVAQTVCDVALERRFRISDDDRKRLDVVHEGRA